MEIAYNIFIYLYGFAIYLSSFFSQKAKYWVEGRKKWENELGLLAQVNYPKIWVHCASLGEFEQARPLLERLSAEDKNYFLILTFFSPSGFEVRKNYPIVNKVMYLPLDTPSNAKKFISLVNPSIAVFTKYDIWHNYLTELKEKNIPSLLFSANFRKDQHYFKWYGNFFRKSLRCFYNIYVQNEESKKLLKEISIDSEIVPDTRFDRVKFVANQPKLFPALAKLNYENKVIIAGSTWPKDEVLIREAWPKLKQLSYKLIIAPHDINENRLKNIRDLFGETADLFSAIKSDTLFTNDIIIVDTIGDLSSIYNHCHIAYVGGGFNASVHNVLEPAAFGLLVIFGSNHQKSTEAIALLKLGGAFSVMNSLEFSTLIQNLSEEKIKVISKINSNFINDNIGGTELVYSYIKQHIRP